MSESWSFRHPEVQRVRKLLRDRRARDAERAYVVEGRILVAEAVAAGAPVRLVLLGPDAEAPPGADPATVVRVAAGVVERVADTVTPQPVLAVLDRPVREDIGGGGLVAVLAGVADPGNVGTILRAAEAAGADGVVAAEGSADPYGPKAVRASGGAIFRLPVVVGGPIVAVLAALAASGRRVLGADAAGPAYEDVDLGGAVALVVGREVGGLPADAARLLDGLVGIPMAGRADSLNAAMAATVLLVEAARQRRRAG
jgi:TrmH family RNA methyltransferase